MEWFCVWIGSTGLRYRFLHRNLAWGKGRTLLDTIRPPHLFKWRWWTSGSWDLHISKFLQTNETYSFSCIFFTSELFAFLNCRYEICCHRVLYADHLGYGRGSWGSLFIVGDAHPYCRTHQGSVLIRRRFQCVHWCAKNWWWFDIDRSMWKWGAKPERCKNDPLDFGTWASSIE